MVEKEGPNSNPGVFEPRSTEAILESLRRLEIGGLPPVEVPGYWRDFGRRQLEALGLRKPASEARAAKRLRRKLAEAGFQREGPELGRMRPMFGDEF